MTTPKTQYNSARASAEFTGEKLAKYCYQGDTVSFQEAFTAYLDKHSNVDPFGRMPLEFQIRERVMSGILSFRTMSTDPEGLGSALKMRWQSWMSILPLDLQLNLLIMESSPQFPGMVDPATLKWDQWRDIQASEDQESAYTASPMKEVDYWGCADITIPWEIKEDRLVSDVRIRAIQLMEQKSWEDLAAWMEAGQIHACTPIDWVQICYTDEDFRTRAHQSKAVQPLPFWMMGLFAGATESEFWKVMHRFGGPSGPSGIFQEQADPGANTPPVGKPGSCLANCPPIGQWNNPLSWLEPNGPLHPLALNMVERTHASWMHGVMEASVSSPTTPVRHTAPRL